MLVDGTAGDHRDGQEIQTTLVGRAFSPSTASTRASHFYETRPQFTWRVTAK